MRHTRRVSTVWVIKIAAVLVALCVNNELAVAGTGVDKCIARNGNAEAVIVVGAKADGFYHWIAEELQSHLKKLTGAQLQIVTDDNVPKNKTLIVVGAPKSNSLIDSAIQKELINTSGLKTDGFVLKTGDVNGLPALLITGNDENGVMYGAYDLLERLGMVFQLTGDVIPQHKSDLVLPALDIRIEPTLKDRGIFVWHAYSWNRSLQEYRNLIDQMVKLKLNRFEFAWGMGSPFLEFSYNGQVAELTTTPESGYLAVGKWNSQCVSGHSTTGTAKDIRVGREVFPQEYVGAPEFASVRTPEEACRTARGFLHEIISYAHQRHVQVSLLLGELSYVPANFADHPTRYQRYCGIALPPGDPRLLEIWDKAMRTLIETYPEANSYGFFTTEDSPDLRDPRTQEILHQYAKERAKLQTVDEIRKHGNVIVNSAEQLDCDFLQIYLSAELVKRIKLHHPDVKLGILTLFRGYKLAVLDSMVPKDVWLGNMEECATTKSTMNFYAGITGRDLFVMPRVVDDGDEMNMQFNATEYDQDEIISGAAKYGLAGFTGQTLHLRNAECNIRYLSEGAWNPQIRPQSFYESYLSRLYGSDALEPLLKAFLILEENEKAMVYWGRSEIFVAFQDFSPLALLRTNVNYRSDPLTVNLKPTVELKDSVDSDNPVPVKKTAKLNREELVKAINSTWGMGPFWEWRGAIASQHADDVAGTEGKFYEKRAVQCRQALDLLRQARAKVLPGSRAELEYVIYKTESFASYFDVLIACYEATVALDRAWIGLFDKNSGEFRSQLLQCQAALDRADRLAKESAGQMIAYADDSTERYLLLRYNRNVIVPIENAQKYVAEVIAFQKGHSLLGTETPKSGD